jgi:GT2 family glycosyltransferase
VVAVIVTWNRRADVLRVLGRLARQAESCGRLYAIVVDNASDDGTWEAIRSAHAPELLVENRSAASLTPDFAQTRLASPGTNTVGLASLTVVRNRENLGGCGGFNVGFKQVEAAFGAPGASDGPDFVWLLDDDVDLPPDALGKLLAAAATDPGITLVGSRTVDLADRRTTIESTIYYNPAIGLMGPEPSGEHPLAREHAAWRGDGSEPRWTGVIDVDVVSACSVVVRWAGLAGVGYWDERFFLYCDDADWCLRVKRAGGRVVCALEAVVYHTPWSHKLTPRRAYYIDRNIQWMIRKHTSGSELRRVTLRWCARLLRRARSAALNRRLSEGELALRSLCDAVANRGGRLAGAPVLIPTISALSECGALAGEAVVIVRDRAGLLAAEDLRARITNELIGAGRAGDLPRWRIVLPESIARPEHGGDPPRSGAHRPTIVAYRPTRASKLLKQIALVRRRPDAVIVIDHAGEFPLLVGRTTLHVRSEDLGVCEAEAGGLGALARFGVSWALAAARGFWYVLTVRPHTDDRGS